MPLFEYECRGCGRQFEAFVTAERVPVCPACEGDDLTKLLSSPGMVGTAGPDRERGNPCVSRTRWTVRVFAQYLQLKHRQIVILPDRRSR